jgi:hypothetical protein
LLTQSFSPQNFFYNYTKNLVLEEIEKQADALDFSSNSGLADRARVYGKYLFTAPGQSEKTKAMWLREAMKSVDKMSMADIRDDGIGPVVKEAMIVAIKKECGKQAVEFATSTGAIIDKLREQE